MGSKKIYVGNLPYETTADDLKARLGELGLAPDEVVVPTDRDTGRGRGFGFARFATEAAAGEAINVVHGATMGTRTMRADAAEERPPRSGGGGGGGGGGGRDWRDDRRGRR
jgi:RNA recognition motif-containing protein